MSQHGYVLSALCPQAQPDSSGGADAAPQFNSLNSPYYNDTHRQLRNYARTFIDEHIMPSHLDWEAAGEAPRDIALKYAQSGLPFGDVPLAYRPKQFHTVAGIPIEKLDAFHMLVLTDESSRLEGGVGISLAGASAIGLPPVVHHGTEEQKRKWLPGVFTWETSFCLGITEPTGGSDVSNIRTTARKSEDGREYVVNGHKKWITGAYVSLFNVVASGSADNEPQDHGQHT